mmetsp:Transcript_7747/g.18927  ORF Transcript_7747/g.18927 Transcript_7747/m.18927 type:complete len:200 (-) Transcript_7747:507-1106(-)
MPSRTFIAITAALAAPAVAWQGPAPACARTASRVGASNVRAGLFDGVKDAFKNPTAPQDEDRITPIDRWLGIDKDLVTPKKVVTFVDPQMAENYHTAKLAKPMGIKFLENEGGLGGIIVDSLLPDGSASTTGASIQSGDQLVAVDSSIVLGLEFEEALGAIQSSVAEEVSLVFFRGGAQFLYGPTKPEEEWLRTEVMKA